MAKKQEGKELVPVKENALVQQGGPVDSSIFESDAGSGFDNIGIDDLAIPFITVLQAGSPQVKRGDQRIEDASEGDIFNTVTNEVFNGEEGIFVIPCSYKKAWVEWVPRENGGGFVKQHDTDDILTETTKDTKGRDIMPNGNVIVPTAYHYVLVINPLTLDYSEGVLSLTSTQLKKSRKWNSLMSSLKLTRQDGSKFTPPMFGFIYHLKTKTESNELGSWSGWDISLHSQVNTMDVYNAAKKFAADVAKGIKIAAPQTLQQDEEVAY